MFAQRRMSLRALYAQLIVCQLFVTISETSRVINNDGELWASKRFRSSSGGRDKLIGGSMNSRQATSVQSRPAGRSSIAKTAQDKQQPLDEEFTCAQYCLCSVIRVLDRSTSVGSKVNLSMAECASAQFTDLLTIDRKTQIIHISLPPARTKASNFEDSNDTQDDRSTFRMPRLIQFNLLRELVIINLKFKVCDSEVFKRGQKLRRLRLNHNQLSRISKACLRHLDKLIELNLNYNQLDELESALFSSLTSLKTLSIAHNELAKLAAHQFANLTQLETLNLVGNSFKSINLHLFEPMQTSLKLLLLAQNQIQSFIHSPIQIGGQTASSLSKLAPKLNPQANNESSRIQPSAGTISTINQTAITQHQQLTFAVGVLFKNLIKLNVDHNQLERVKSLQLYRFFNLKFLSIRNNSITNIRDKAFNGLKLIELNLAHNQLQLVSKCAFCEATIRRLILSHNNISLPKLSSQLALDSASASSSQQVAANSIGLQQPVILALNKRSTRLDTSQLLDTDQADQSVSNQMPEKSALIQKLTSSAAAEPPSNMLILSQSIFAPLFDQLEYLDLSNNEQLGEQLEFLLEPLLKLEYLRLINVGFDRSLPSPTLFKNLRQLRYLNLSHNQLDQVIAETIEPLSQLEVLDLSHNKFSELDESFLVTLDEMPSIRIINLGSNPWFCSQCKVSPLHDWIFRSSIYNSSCIAPDLRSTSQPISAQEDSSALDNNDANEDNNADLDNDDDKTEPKSPDQVAAKSMFRASAIQDFEKSSSSSIRPDYSLLIGNGNNDDLRPKTLIDFDLIKPTGGHQGWPTHDETSESGNQASRGYNLAPGEIGLLGAHQLEDSSIVETLTSVLSMANDGNKQVNLYDPSEYCLKCEFPSELRSFKLHELTSADFKFCAGRAPRIIASEPKIGLTLAIVIIGALFCIIVVVIIMYRKKSNTYYPNEDTDRLDSANGTGGKKPVFSISSDAENNQFGDGTDYSSPPMSQSYDSYSQEDEEEEDEDEEEEDEGEEELTGEEQDEELELEEEEDYLDEESSGYRDTSGQAQQSRNAANEHQQVAKNERKEPTVSVATEAENLSGSVERSGRQEEAAKKTAEVNRPPGANEAIASPPTGISIEPAQKPINAAPLKVSLWGKADSEERPMVSADDSVAPETHHQPQPQPQHHHQQHIVNFNLEKPIQMMAGRQSSEGNLVGGDINKQPKRNQHKVSEQSPSMASKAQLSTSSNRQLKADEVSSANNVENNQQPIHNILKRQATSRERAHQVSDSLKRRPQKQAQAGLSGILMTGSGSGSVGHLRQASLDQSSSTAGSEQRMRRAKIKSAQTIEHAGLPNQLRPAQPDGGGKIHRDQFRGSSSNSATSRQVSVEIPEKSKQVNSGARNSSRRQFLLLAHESIPQGLDINDEDGDFERKEPLAHSRGGLVRSGANRIDHEQSVELGQRLNEAELPRGRQMAPQPQPPPSNARRPPITPSPSASDATTADSLALEALDYVRADDSDLELDRIVDTHTFGPNQTSGCALELAEGNSLEQLEIETRRFQPDHLSSSTGPFRMRASHSSHSALTQTSTGSRDFREDQ